MLLFVLAEPLVLCAPALQLHPEHVVAAVFTYPLAHVATVHKLLTVLLLQLGVAHVDRFAMLEQVDEHAVFAVAL